MKRNASAEWRGGLKDGKGTISTDSGVLEQTQYSFSTRYLQSPFSQIAIASGPFIAAMTSKYSNDSFVSRSFTFGNRSSTIRTRADIVSRV